MLTLEDIVKKAQGDRASDIHIVKGLPVKYRIDGKLKSLTEDILTEEDCIGFAKEMAEDDFEKLEEIGELDLAKTFGKSIRTRINIYRQQGFYSTAIRILAEHIPEISELGLPPIVNELPSYRAGIVLVTGETGSGKSTTLASVLNTINKTRPVHIITLEDPIEYIYTPDKAVINQREIGADTESYDNGLRAILREDPDVILIGEMRDLSTIEIALTAAETGHLVFATLHTGSAAESVDRMINVFPEGQQKQIRLQVSTSLRCVLSQQLLPKIGSGRVAAVEVMVVSPAIRNLIREGKTPQIESFITMGASDGSITMDAALQKLVREGQVDLQTALSYARDKENFRKGGRL